MRSPLYEAVLTGNVQDVKRVLANSVSDFIDNLDDEGLSLLHQATMNGFDDIVALLIEHGASVGLLSAVGSTPLLIALRYCSLLLSKSMQMYSLHGIAFE